MRLIYGSFVNSFDSSQLIDTVSILSLGYYYRKISTVLLELISLYSYQINSKTIPLSIERIATIHYKVFHMRGFKQKPLSRLSVSDSATECSSCSGGAVRTAGQEDSSIDSSASILAANTTSNNNTSNSTHIADANTSTTVNTDSTGMGVLGGGQSTKDISKFITNDTYTSKSPVGFMITEALNRKLSHESSIDSIAGHSGVAVEELAGSVHAQTVNNTYANGMIGDTSNGSVVRLKRAVGVIPMPGIKPTALNTIIDAMGKVKEVDFVMVHKQTIDPSDDKPATNLDISMTDDKVQKDESAVGVAADIDEINNSQLIEEVAAIESVEVIIHYSTKR